MTDLIERLRLTDPKDKTVSGILQEAADEIERLRGAIRNWSDARQAMMAGSAEGKPWSASSIGALGFAEALLVAALEDSR